MAIFKIVISEPKSRKSFQVEIDQSKAAGLIGKKIGYEFDGDILGLNGYTLQITGGTDKDGFPMHPRLKGSGRKKLLLEEPPGFHPRLKGQRRRKTVRGNTISDAIVQINTKVVKMGEKPFEQLLPKKEKPKEVAKEGPKEVPKEKTKEEKKEERAEKKEEKKQVEKESITKPQKKSETKPSEVKEEKKVEDMKEKEKN